MADTNRLTPAELADIRDVDARWIQPQGEVVNGHRLTVVLLKSERRKLLAEVDALNAERAAVEEENARLLRILRSLDLEMP